MTSKFSDDDSAISLSFFEVNFLAITLSFMEGLSLILDSLDSICAHDGNDDESRVPFCYSSNARSICFKFYFECLQRRNENMYTCLASKS